MDIEEFKHLHLATINRWQTPLKEDEWIANYYHRHCKMFDNMMMGREKFMNGLELNPDDNEHKNFLEILLLRKDNDIASVGSGAMNQNEFDNLIKDSDVLNSIAEIFKNPNKDTIYKLNDITSKHLRDNHGIVNRIVVSCTHEVSAVVINNFFSRVFKSLTEKEIIKTHAGTQDWYHQNLHLMNELGEIFAEELGSGKTNIMYLRVFIWYLASNPDILNKR